LSQRPTFLGHWIKIFKIAKTTWLRSVTVFG